MSWLDNMMRDMINAPARHIWVHHGLPPDDTERLHLSNNPEPSLDSCFKLGTAAQTSVGLSALAASRFHALRTDIEGSVRVDSRHALIEFAGERYYTIDGQLPEMFEDDELTDQYVTKDGGMVRLNMNFPHHKEGLLKILGCEADKATITAVMAEQDSSEFIDKVMKAELVATDLHSFDTIDATSHGRSTVNISPVSITKIGEAPRRSIEGVGEPEYALEGIRVLDLTRIIAGPVAARTLAAHGADVLHVSAPHLPAVPKFDVETTRCKRTTQLDLNKPEEKATLEELVKDADVFLQSYAPKALEKRGFGAKAVAEMRPGIVYASLTALAHTAVYWDRRAYNFCVEMLEGLQVQEAETYKEWLVANDKDASQVPRYKPLPMRAISHLAGQLLAFGIEAALCKTITEGGTWEVHVSLESVALWLRAMGSLTPEEAYDEGEPLPERTFPLAEEVAGYSITVERDDGDVDSPDTEQPTGSTMTVIRHAAEMEATRIKEGKAPMRLNAHKPEWLPRPAA
ncbi:unnamed protein product [Peniophora sp. CBMAI 1063]|nr:unnamed protein product [Peniophora sp. CBMAI 1063]